MLVPVVLVAGAAAPAAAAPPTREQQSNARTALKMAQRLADGQGVRNGRELTPALNRLYQSLPDLSAGDRQSADGLLARPGDTAPDPPGSHKWSPAAFRGTPYCPPHFCIHYVTTSSDAPSTADTPVNGIPDYVEWMGTLLEETYACENGTGPNDCATGSSPGLGWRGPADDSVYSAGGIGLDQVASADLPKLDVYIADLYPDRIYGYVAIDSGQSQDPTVPHTAYMVLDKDYARFQGAAGADAVERVTIAHEYNHVLQNVYDYAQDVWMFEATAVWVEDKVYPQINDYLNYVAAWSNQPKVPLTPFDGNTLKPYGSAVWNHFLESRYGAGVVRAAWEGSSAAGDFAPAAYAQAILNAGGAGFGDEFSRFSATAAEWRVPGSGFPDTYPDVRRESDIALPIGGFSGPFALPHTTFAFFNVQVPQSSTPKIRLIATLPDGTNGALALVGRPGADPSTGPVTRNVRTLPSGGVGSVELDNPAGFGRITAVIVNSDVSRSGFDQAKGDWVYTRDASSATAALEAPSSPQATTGAASGIRDHSAAVGGSVDSNLLDTTWHFEYGPSVAYGKRTPTQTASGAALAAVPVGVQLSGLTANKTYHYRLVAGNSLGSIAGSDLTFRTARDVTAPALVVTAKRQKIKRVRSSGALYKARCSERCTGTAQIEITKNLARRLGLPRVLGKARVSLKARPASSSLRVRLGARAKQRLAALGRLKVTLRVGVADASKNKRTVVRTVSLSR
jgi:hypothetical protein